MGVRIRGLHVSTGQAITVEVAEGRIAGVLPDAPDRSEALPFVAPGLVDLQLNGVGGFDFNSPAVTREDVAQITRTLLQEGVTSYFPTVVTNSDEAIEHELGQIAASRAHDKLCERCIPGIHLEGPFISPEDGARGAHPCAHVKAPDWDRFERWQAVSDGAIRLVTLSPEWPGAARFISRCVDSGVTVAIGHTAASPEQIREAVSAGARFCTHLGNGSHTMIHRHRSYLWEQLACDGLYASLIPDGFHLPWAFLKVALRAKGHRAVLVSDAVALSGLPPGEYETDVGGRVVLRADGKLHLAGNPDILAGSAQLLPWGIAHLTRTGLATLADAWDMASARPARFMGLPAGEGLSVGAPADIATFQWDGAALHIERVIKDGVMVRDHV